MIRTSPRPGRSAPPPPPLLSSPLLWAPFADGIHRLIIDRCSTYSYCCCCCCCYIWHHSVDFNNFAHSLLLRLRLLLSLHFSFLSVCVIFIFILIFFFFFCHPQITKCFLLFSVCLWLFSVCVPCVCVWVGGSFTTCFKSLAKALYQIYYKMTAHGRVEAAEKGRKKERKKERTEHQRPPPSPLYNTALIYNSISQRDFHLFFFLSIFVPFFFMSRTFFSFPLLFNTWHPRRRRHHRPGKEPLVAVVFFYDIITTHQTNREREIDCCCCCCCRGGDILKRRESIPFDGGKILNWPIIFSSLWERVESFL